MCPNHSSMRRARSLVRDRPDHAGFWHGVELRCLVEVGEHFAVIHHIHGASIIGEDDLVRPLETAAIFRFLIGIGSGIDIVGKLAPLDPGWLEEVDPQHHGPGWNEALRPSVKDAVDRAEQSIVGAEATVRFAVAVLPVPPFVDETLPVTLVN